MSNAHAICTREQWNEARRELLAQEKQFTRLRDELSAKRRALPWVAVDRDYVFHGARGELSLQDLFADKSQLVVYHFMFAPEWEAGCKACSFMADNFDNSVIHLAHRDVSFVAVSRAPVAKLAAYAKRLGWSFPWVSSEGSSFNYDFAVSFTEEQRASEQLLYNYGTLRPRSSDHPGISVFYRHADGTIFHTYSCYARGIELVNATYQFLDLLPKGRDEDSRGMFWVRRNDEYEPSAQPAGVR